jgi:D-alanine-D-alanine ligase-like ATP-grasp enzyme
VRAFQDVHRRLIFKSISSVRSIVQELMGPRIGQLDRIRALPVQFQQLLRGTEIRVHVAGSELFATEILSNVVDYRYAGREGQDVEMKVCELPAPIRERCFQLSRMLDLPLCGIDLKLTPDGTYYCFEVNPSPGFSYFQQQTGQDIAGGIVRYLAGKQQEWAMGYM